MKRSFFAICSVLIAAIILVALVPGCTPTEPGPEATVEVKATYYGDPWEGTMLYDLTSGNTTVDGNAVPGSHTVAPGTWSIEVGPGGPLNGYVVSIDPSDSQAVTEDGTITFTVDFARYADARIEGSPTWTINGTPASSDWADLYGTRHIVGPGTVIGIEFQQRYEAGPGANVTLNETAWLGIYHVTTWQTFPLLGRFHVANNACAVEKVGTYQPEATAEKLEQNVGIWDYYGIWPCLSWNFSTDWLDPWYFPAPTTYFWTIDTPSISLNEQSLWSLDSGVLYDKTINWLTIGSGDWVSEECVLFQLVEDQAWPTFIVLLATARVDLVGVEDVVPGNNAWADFTPPLVLEIP